ncbi:ester cyclase [Streptomyces sp. NPDC088353]|uniref:ester cyclase n=1 Tax=unclassified Streptomyces TaxID=2593676 RepID=UPI00367D3D9C
MSDAEARRAAIRSTWSAAWDKGEVAAFDALLSPAYRRFSRYDDTGQDRMEFKSSVVTTRSAFPDLTTVIDDIVVEGDRAAIRWHSEGTHRHGFLGVPPTRRRVSVSGATFARFENDLVVEEFVTWDPRELLAALGIVTVGQDR